MEPLRKGEVIEGHRVLDELGRGAASIIYLAQDEKSKQIYALKHVKRETPKDQRFLEQAEYEYKVASKLDHPNIRKIRRMMKRKHLLKVKDLFLVMELVDGVAMDQKPPKTFDDALSVFQQVALALGHMQTASFVERLLEARSWMNSRQDNHQQYWAIYSQYLSEILSMWQSLRQARVVIHMLVRGLRDVPMAEPKVARMAERLPRIATGVERPMAAGRTMDRDAERRERMTSRPPGRSPGERWAR